MDEPEQRELRNGVTGPRQRGWVYAQNALSLSLFSAMIAVVISALALIVGDVLCLVLSCIVPRDKAATDSTPEVHSSASMAALAESVDLDAEIAECRQAMAVALPDQLAILVPRVAELAQALMVRFHKHGSLDDLDKQVELCDKILELLGPAYPSGASLLHELADPLRIRARLWGRPADLLRSIDLCREGLAHCSTIERDYLLDSLGASLRVWYSHSGDRKHLEEAIEVHEQALQLRPSGHAMRHRSLDNSAFALRLRYLCGGNIEDLELAHERQAETVRLRPQGHPERYIALHQLGNLLVDFFTIRGDHESLEKGTLALEEALGCLGPEHQDRGLVLGCLAGTLTYCFLHNSDVKVADRAVDLLLAALQIQKPGDFDRSRSLANLSNSLLMRFDISDNIDDIDMAVLTQRVLVNTIELNHPGRPAHLGNLANVLWFRYEARKNSGAIDVGELTEAVASAEEVLARRPPGDLKRFHGLYRLARCLRARFAELGDGDDLERAISLHREALASSHANHYDRYLYLSELACAFELRFERRGKNETDAKTALELTMEALNTIPEGYGGRSHLLQQLSRIQLLVGSNTSMQVTATSLCLIRDAILNDGHSANQRCTDGLKILEILKDHSWDTPLRHLLLEVHNLLVRLLPRVAYFGLDLRSRLRVLRESESLANDAVGHALMLSNPTIAVELLEEGRGMFWTQALQLRTPVDSLPEVLADQLVTLSRQLEEESHSEPGEQKVPNDAADQRRRLGQKFEALITEVQTLPGFERFMLPDSYTSLRAASRDGPVVILVASSVACQAIVLANPTAEARQIPLEISYEHLCRLGAITRDESMKYRKAQEQRGMKVVRAPSDRSYALLSELWNSVVFPAIDGIKLKKTSGKARPRVWWCPTGPFASLPLHAAGIYQGTGADNCSEYCVSSYTPTLRALIFAQRQIDHMAGHPQVLLASVPRPPGMSSLPYAVEEIQAVKKSFPAELILDLSLEKDATSDTNSGVNVATLLDNLPQASIFHLASHARQVPNDPLKSGFVMQDNILTVACLMKLKLPHAAFAFLSACETAMGDESQPDQTVHLAAAMMFVGFRSVVGTMWAMGDQDGPVIASAVYRELFKDGQLDLAAVPYALDDAVRSLRAFGVHPSRWATYIHLGA